jgi:hypothetical protein
MPDDFPAFDLSQVPERFPSLLIPSELLKINHLQVGTLHTPPESMWSESHGSAHTLPDLARQQIFKGAVGWKIL